MASSNLTKHTQGQRESVQALHWWPPLSFALLVSWGRPPNCSRELSSHTGPSPTVAPNSWFVDMWLLVLTKAPIGPPGEFRPRGFKKIGEDTVHRVTRTPRMRIMRRSFLSLP
jgi:hypothetical protein